MTEHEGQPMQFVAPSAAGVQTTSLLAYQSAGHCLVIGPLEQALAAVAGLSVAATTVFVPDSQLSQVTKQATEDGVHVYRGAVQKLSGYLGAFDIEFEGQESLASRAGVAHGGGFDTVLDLCNQALIDVELVPFGYFPVVASDPAALASAIDQLQELEGEFEKPRYFEYHKAICAHSRSAITACSNCLEVCSTGAITSAGDGIFINPYLCQGCGSCATVCPSGATRYAYPAPADAISQLRKLLQTHRTQSNHQAAVVVYLHDTETGQRKLEEFRHQLPANILPVAVEETGSVGIDVWLSALAMGADAMFIDASQPSGGMTQALSSQLAVAVKLLSDIGEHGHRLGLVNGGEELLQRSALIQPSGITPASYATFNDKRQTIRFATDHLAAHSEATKPIIPLPPGAPFGEVRVDTAACTLCLACVTVCPARALQDGETLPQLKFIESACLQCGTCEKACPENAISLSPRYVVDSDAARKPRVLNEEKPFHCVVCHKPFATQQIISRMTSKLSEHWMFANQAATRRLKMCGDCRVKDIFESSEGGIEVHKHSG